MIPQDFGKFLKKRRLMVGMTQTELSKILGYTPQFIANWERGASSPPHRVIPKVSKALKIPPKEMIKFLVDSTERFWKEVVS